MCCPFEWKISVTADCRKSNRFEGGLQIVNQIAHVFHANREPDQRISDTQFFALFLWNGGMCHERRMIDEALHTAQAFGQREQMRVFEKTLRSGEVRLQNDCYDSTEAAHLLPREIVLRMGLYPRVTDRFHRWLFFQPARNFE